jgi:hypothetical protein
MTENEAKTKYCCGPLLLAETWINEEAIKAEHEMKTGRCLASACMAWRRDYEEDSLGKDGYCGLAGRP